MKNAFNRFVYRLAMAEKRITELEEMSVEIPKLNCRQKKSRKEQNIHRIVDNCKGCNICVREIIRRRTKGKEQKKYLKE